MSKPTILTCVAAMLVLSACAHKGPAGAGAPGKGNASAAAAAKKRPRPETPEFWTADGKAALAKAQLAPPAPAARARNLILFVGDGLGVTTVTAARILQGQQMKEPQPGEDNALAFETLPATALIKTYNEDLQIPESAGSMTAMMSGVKTRGASVGLDGVPTRGQCAEAKAHEVKSLLEEAKDNGMSAGLVTNMRVTHAVPAAAYAHVSDRDWEVDDRLPQAARDQNCKDIARWLVEFDHHGPLDVVLAGGRAAFLPKLPEGAPDDPNRYGARGDGQDLIAAWRRKYPTGRYYLTGSDIAKVDWAAVTGPVLGLFARDNLRFEDRRVQDSSEPSLTQMTKTAIAGLSRNQRGYVLVIDAGGIDRAHHAGDARDALLETIELSNAVKAAMDSTSATDTLIVVASTNGHTLTMGGIGQRGNPILGLSRDSAGLARDVLGKPYTTLGYANGPGAPPTAPREDTPDDQRVMTAAVRLDGETHGGQDTPLYAGGPGSQWFHGVLEQNAVYWIARAALNDFKPPPAPAKRAWYKPPPLPKELPKIWPFGKKDDKKPDDKKADAA